MHLKFKWDLMDRFFIGNPYILQADPCNIFHNGCVRVIAGLTQTPRGTTVGVMKNNDPSRIMTGGHFST
uniref:Uncharacterized protein n=1 Tax=Magallana gigas TaxID=29159 RepID=A0A8W8I857_MAGGI